MKRLWFVIVLVLVTGTVYAQQKPNEQQVLEELRQMRDAYVAKKNLERPVMVIEKTVGFKSVDVLRQIEDAQEKKDAETMKKLVQVDMAVIPLERGQKATYLDDSESPGWVWARLPGRDGRWLVGSAFLALLQ